MSSLPPAAGVASGEREDQAPGGCRSGRGQPSSWREGAAACLLSRGGRRENYYSYVMLAVSVARSIPNRLHAFEKNVLPNALEVIK
jgi:hypothetical protein